MQRVAERLALMILVCLDCVFDVVPLRESPKSVQIKGFGMDVVALFSEVHGLDQKQKIAIHAHMVPHLPCDQLVGLHKKEQCPELLKYPALSVG